MGGGGGGGGGWWGCGGDFSGWLLVLYLQYKKNLILSVCVCEKAFVHSLSLSALGVCV